MSELKPLVKYGPSLAIDELAAELGHCATLLKQVANDNANARTAKAEAKYKQPGVFAIGDRVVMRGTALHASGSIPGRDCARVWTVVECDCDLCEQAGERVVAVDQEVDGYGWRHIATKAVRHYGQPTVDELTAAEHSQRLAALNSGLRLGPRTYQRRGSNA